MSDGQREQQAPKSARDDGAMSRSKSGSQLPLPTNIRSSPSMIAAAITRKILGAPLVTTKDAPHHRTYASGSCEEKWTRIEGLCPQGQTSDERSSMPSLVERGPLSSPRMSPYTMVKAIMQRIIITPLHCKEKDPGLPSLAQFVTGTLKDKLEWMDGLIRGLGQSIKG
uniref:Uncharacterized protein n=1 Tax=Trichogramma kaykai TaxID=54128 RepID=A0ABD2X0Z6_9HYME